MGQMKNSFNQPNFNRIEEKPFVSLNHLSTRLFFLVIFASLLILVVACKPKETPEAKYSRLVAEATELKKQEKFEEARITLLNAIDLQPNQATAYFDIAEVFVATKQLPKALENYRIALDLDPENRLTRLRIAAFMALGGELEQAESNLQKLLEKNSNDIDAILISASVDVVRNNYEGAKDKVKKVLQISPDNPQALATLADISIKENDGASAEAYYKKALSVEPTNEAIRISLADLYSRMGRLNDAETIVISVLTDNPKNSTLRFYYAEFLLERGLIDKAVPQYEQILQYDPLIHNARDRLYDAYLTSGQIDKARALAQDLISRFPKDPTADYFNGRLAQLDKKPSEALQYFIKAITTLTNFAPAFRHAGLAELFLGRVGEGVEHLNQAIAINPFDIGARLALARDSFVKRDYAQAIEHVNKVLSRHPHQIGANILRADLALVQNDFKTAETIYKLVQETFPNSPLPYFKFALLAEKSGDNAKSIENYKKVISFDQEPYIAINRLAHILVATEGFDRAIQEMLSLRDQSKQSIAEHNYILGELYRYKPNASNEDKAKAKAYYDEAIAIKAKFMPPYFSLADLDFKSGNINEAIDRYQKIIQAQPKHLPSHILLALIYESRKDYQKAADLYRQVLSFAPSFAPAVNNLAWLLVEHLNGNIDEALTLAQQAKREMPNEANIADTLGWVYYKQGSFRAAATELAEAINLEQSNAGKLSAELLYHMAVVKEALGEREIAKDYLLKAKNAATPGSSISVELQKLEESLK
ncbi:MAG: tetratricopeptide repeat protein [Deltaproteobacteria bacterium]|nr:tetratricopeptide repeat protein [Deltaproteobacteria bacterium]